MNILWLAGLQVSVEKSADSLTAVSFKVTNCFSLAAFKILSLSFTFAILGKGLGVGLFGWNLFGTLSASWTCVSFSFTRLGTFSVIISPKRFLTPVVSLLLPVPLWGESWYAWCCHRVSWGNPHFLDSFCCCCSLRFWLPYFTSYWFDSVSSNCCWFPLLYFLFQLLYSSFMTGSFLWFLCPFHAVEVLTELLEHYSYHCSELCME